MKKTKSIIICGFVSLCCLIAESCNKQNDWLQPKSNKNSVIPQSTVDFQALMDPGYTMNYVYSTAGLVGADNSYIPDATFPTVAQTEANLYLWKPTVWVGVTVQDWNNYFKIIETANVVLDGLKKVSPTAPQYNNVKGEALFYRAYAYYNLAQLFCKAYNSATATSDLGLPIRTTSDVNVIVQRSSLKDTYDQMVADVLQSATLLPSSQPYLQRPINAAAYALLAKIYLNEGDYAKAESYATDEINVHPALLDYNDATVININSTYRFPAYGKGNPEILFFASGVIYRSTGPITSSPGLVVNDLYQSYNDNDLRKTIFYKTTGSNVQFRGAYTGNAYNFCGLATNEVYLIRAECEARLGQTTTALSDLNLLLSHRYLTSTFTPLTAADANAALLLVLQERRKELPFVSNIRWEDLKRLNQDPNFAITLTRTINGTTYTLPPNDKLYVLPIPDNEVQMTGLQQNDR